MTNDPDVDPDNQIAEIVDTLLDLRDQKGRSIGAMIDHLGVASFTPILLFVSLVIVTPLSGVPGLSSVCGLLISIVSAQLLLGRQQLWLPDYILRRHMPGQKLHTALSSLEGPMRWVQNVTTRRMAVLTLPPFSYLLYSVCFLCGAAMPFLELVPMTSSLLAAVVALLSISLISKDGVFALLGLTGLVTTAVLVITIGQLIS
ncbi:exopolysaccharide biosynthesis protein [Aliiroseovarius sp. F47248L]|uniref:exopolysaccharide biosynthesis protein n=1 Tax=Aliiroseovarius sp. F47248L TaxID=2926420 RepID=UPI001FF6B04E|nr:exopolysaccharide biosynthesis protein [Aliiroseovarius sp. F47248L]MCK0139241.1 exopolysaccharide biosynthesis protein [Aliiroseovarius sp. F47248L]